MTKDNKYKKGDKVIYKRPLLSGYAVGTLDVYQGFYVIVDSDDDWGNRTVVWGPSIVGFVTELTKALYL